MSLVAKPLVILTPEQQRARSIPQTGKVRVELLDGTVRYID